MRPRLFRFEQEWVDAAYDAIFPPPPKTALAHGIDKMHPARFFDDVVATSPLEQALGMRLALWIVALAPLFALRRLATISSLDVEDRPRAIEWLLASPIYVVRQLVMGFKALGSLLYSQSTEVYAQMITPRAIPIVQLRLKRSDPPPPPAGDSREHAAE